MTEEEKTLLQRIEESPLKNPALAALAKDSSYDYLHPLFEPREQEDFRNLGFALNNPHILEQNATTSTTNNVSGNGFDEGNNPIKSSCEN